MPASRPKKKARTTALTHVDADGSAHMVDVSGKHKTLRTATAEAFVSMNPSTVEVVSSGGLAKGDALSVSKIAGIMAAKRTHDLIPLCHPLALSAIDVDIEMTQTGARIVSTVKTNDRTGVEMEALVAATVSALTIYDMCKAVDKAITIDRVRLLEKTGGKSGSFKADE